MDWQRSEEFAGKTDKLCARELSHSLAGASLSLAEAERGNSNPQFWDSWQITPLADNFGEIQDWESVRVTLQKASGWQGGSQGVTYRLEYWLFVLGL